MLIDAQTNIRISPFQIDGVGHGHAGESVSMMVPPDHLNAVIAILDARPLNYSVNVDNVQA